MRRQADELLPLLLETALKSTDAAFAREAFWSFLSLQAPTAEGSPQLHAAAAELLKSPHAVVRYWTVRWLGDCGTVSDALAHHWMNWQRPRPAHTFAVNWPQPPHAYGERDTDIIRRQTESRPYQLTWLSRSSMPTSIAIATIAILSCHCSGGGPSSGIASAVGKRS